NLRHVALPALTVALGEFAVFTRVLRAEMISVLDSDFILAARAKGMPTWRILWTEALRPSSFSLVTVAGVSLGRLIGGTMIVEVLFNLPGMGRLIVDSIGANDFTTVQGAVLVMATFYVVINGAVDLTYSVIDPRVRHAGN
ncbi:MAG TPA: ABC transporter permease, partial [Acidimicrobiales bacterium]